MHVSGGPKGQIRTIDFLAGVICQDSKLYIEIKGPKSATQLAARLRMLCFVTQGAILKRTFMLMFERSFERIPEKKLERILERKFERIFEIFFGRIFERFFERNFE